MPPATSSSGDVHRRTHRFSWELHFGPIPEGLHVLHNCPGGDNPACVNPAHLWLGTDADNSADSIAKGRWAVGERISNAKLTAADVIAIRQRHAAGGVTQVRLAEEFGVSTEAIRRILRKQVWKHI